MTRKEEREQASNLVFKIRLCPRTAFIRGAEWADRNPRKGLWDSEKVIQWLQDHADLYTWYDEFEGESGMTDDFIHYLRKAMED